MARPSLDVESVQAFVAIGDFQSFTKAAEALGTTQGAISVKLKRLEERLGYKLIERTPRLVRLSAAGAMFLNPAREFIAAHDRAMAALSSECRRFRLGIAEHVAGPEIPTLLARLNERDPALTIEVRLENSRSLLDAFDNGELDAVIVRQEDDRRDGEDLGPEHFGWFAAPCFHQQPGKPLRLAALAPCCGVRDIATRALLNAGIQWNEVFVGGGHAAVVAAVSAGLAVAAFSCRLAPADTVEVSQSLGLPELTASRIMLHTTLTDGRSRDALRVLAAVYREHR
ncbi:LysR family transcriptional regulator [Pseudomonas gingeri]|uniref:LysR family transcriptional regulator n=1 Tax=Pseudomonas gingeri TaxID=117681 RepID=A0A7Y8C1J2_9PSED|nr:LysR family transcriptional regulator [Pseudomonas gingeri]NWA24349.1 LysR family transcriptional regulator [Pseudomonas gingeri]NWB95674.1 LysR family transcriptional regulator [Pseudomonas gingeri]NWD66809.1 LysR family transcriptional regulator [Pseudomonas gingeri]NWD75971.1 LysR family transcriptional regulator [Pseudomonas gingeri]